MATSLAAPDPYSQLSRIRFPPRVLTVKSYGLTYACQRHHARPAQSPVRGVPVRIPLGPCPSLHRLRRRYRIRVCFVRRLHSYYDRARLPAPVHHRLRLLAFPMRTVRLTQHLTEISSAKADGRIDIEEAVADRHVEARTSQLHAWQCAPRRPAPDDIPRRPTTSRPLTRQQDWIADYIA
jgi:hypothetical protein